MIWRLLTSAGRRQRQRMKHEQAMNDSKNKADTLPEWRPNMNRGRSQDRGRRIEETKVRLRFGQLKGESSEGGL